MHRQLGIVLILVLVTLCAADVVRAADDFKPLFDGKTLKGWTAMPGGKWEVKDGVILGTSAKSERRHGLLASDKEYSDFVGCLLKSPWRNLNS